MKFELVMEHNNKKMLDQTIDITDYDLKFINGTMMLSLIDNEDASVVTFFVSKDKATMFYNYDDPIDIEASIISFEKDYKTLRLYININQITEEIQK